MTRRVGRPGGDNLRLREEVRGLLLESHPVDRDHVRVIELLYTIDTSQGQGR